MFDADADGPDAQPDSAATVSAIITKGKPQRRGSERSSGATLRNSCVASRFLVFVCKTCRMSLLRRHEGGFGLRPKLQPLLRHLRRPVETRLTRPRRLHRRAEQHTPRIRAEGVGRPVDRARRATDVVGERIHTRQRFVPHPRRQFAQRLVHVRSARRPPVPPPCPPCSGSTRTARPAGSRSGSAHWSKRAPCPVDSASRANAPSPVRPGSPASRCRPRRPSGSPWSQAGGRARRPRGICPRRRQRRSSLRRITSPRCCNWSKMPGRIGTSATSFTDDGNSRVSRPVSSSCTNAIPVTPWKPSVA